MADKHHVSNKIARVLASPDRFFPILCVGGMIALLIVILSCISY